MAVPSSGPLELYGDIQNEAGGAQSNTSLHNLSIYAGFSTPDAMSDFYGWADIELGAVTTNSITNLSSNSMRLNGNLTSTGNDTSVQVGFHHGTSTNRASNPTYSAGTKSTTGTFLVNRSGLSYGVAYYAWAYATTDAGTVYGSRVNATTPYPPFTPSPAFLSSTNQSADINPTSAVAINRVQAGYFNPYSATQVNHFAYVCTPTQGNSNRACVCADYNSYYMCNPSNRPSYGVEICTTQDAKNYQEAFSEGNCTTTPWPLIFAEVNFWSLGEDYLCCGNGGKFYNTTATQTGNAINSLDLRSSSDYIICGDAFSTWKGKSSGIRVDYCYQCCPWPR